jgi:hypothetical protein
MDLTSNQRPMRLLHLLDRSSSSSLFRFVLAANYHKARLELCNRSLVNFRHFGI